MSASAPARRQPPPECDLCPRLAAFREEARARLPGAHNAPVPPFGDPAARLLIVGLAPGLRGANRTGRPFTGDYAGEVLYTMLARFGFAAGAYKADPADGFTLIDTRVVNAVRCVPPANKPTPAEIRNCRPFLEDDLEQGSRPAVILVLGRIAHEAVLRALGLRLKAYPFGHGAAHALPDGRHLVASYHSSRYNMNTGRLTEPMFAEVFTTIRGLLPA